MKTHIIDDCQLDSYRLRFPNKWGLIISGSDGIRWEMPERHAVAKEVLAKFSLDADELVWSSFIIACDSKEEAWEIYDMMNDDQIFGYYVVLVKPHDAEDDEEPYKEFYEYCLSKDDMSHLGYTITENT